jgi:DNA-binding IclR family transcriptional regulator
MKTHPTDSPDYAPRPERIAIHVLHVMTTRQRAGKRTNLEDLAEALGVRRNDVRRVVSFLHREGYLDALRMRLSLAGFALGSALSPAELPLLRATPARHSHAA